MRALFLSFTIVLGSLFLTQTLSSQTDTPQGSVRDRIAKKQNTKDKKQSLPELSIRAENMNESQTQNIENAPWIREVYRTLDLEKDKNASLYYPVLPIGERMNLFTMTFKLLATGEIKAYEYLVDGREVFTEEYAVKFKDLLDRFGIMYTEQNGQFVVEESDIPSNEVLRYYVKEAWYFDKTNSVVDVKILAICPVILRQDDFGSESTPNPLFWLPYEQIRPYAARMPIMTSNLNNASTQTIDDFFRKHNFEGEIYKTTNMRNLSLSQIFPVDSVMKKEQAKIEIQLKDFNKKLWAVDPPKEKAATDELVDKKETKEETDGYKVDVRTNEDATKSSSTNGTQASKQKVSTKKESAKKQPTRSMRARRTK